jgi:putative membrane protein
VPDATDPYDTDSMESNSGPSQQDITFVQQATAAGLAEVTEGKLATTKSQNTDVVNFASRMVTDHTAGNEQLTTVAEQEGIQQPTSLPAEQQSEIVSLQSLSDPQFTQAYITGQVDDHVKTLMQFIDEANTGQDPAVVAFAQDQIPVLIQHLQAAVLLDLTLQGQQNDPFTVSRVASSLVPDLPVQGYGAMASMSDISAHMTASNFFICREFLS